MNLGVLAHLKEVTGALDLSGTPYRMIRPIGQGGMGAVYLLEDTRLRREVAMKVLDLGGEALAARLELEARILARLEHPSIVPIHDVGHLADGRVFYVMKFVRGERLDVWLGRGQPLGGVLRIFQRICDAVAFAHARGVVHRDLKPQNVMIGEYGEALVMDWGLAHELPAPGAPPGSATPGFPDSGVATEAGSVFGTPGFMAPEQARGELDKIDARSDVFSLGALLYFLLSGRLPFEGTSTDEVLDRTLSAVPTPVRDHRPELAPALASVCERALEKDPARRYPSVGALAADVGSWLDGLPVAAHRDTLREKVSRWYRKYQVLVLLVAAYLAMRTILALISRH